MTAPLEVGPRTRRRRSALLVAGVATLAWALVLTGVARMRYGGDVRGFLCVGSASQFPAALASAPFAGRTGYDGAMYAALSTDPLFRNLNTPSYLDAPAYRATRILVPMLAWALAFGHSPPAVLLYQLLCWGLGIAAIVVLALWFVEERASPWWALLAAAGAGMAAVAFRSTSDAAALCFVLAALYLHARSKPLSALAFLAAAVLTRETSLIAALAIAGDELRRRRFSTAAAFVAIPVGCGAAWQFFLWRTLGDAFATANDAFALPFAWLPHKLAVTFHGGVRWEEVFGTLAVLATTVALAVLLTSVRAWTPVEATFAAFAGVGLFLSYHVYSETWAYSRALIVVPFLAVLIAGRQTYRWRRWLLLSIAVFYALAGATVALAQVTQAASSRPLLAALRAGTPPGDESRLPRGHDEYPALAPQTPLWVLPVASAHGRAGSLWRTRLAILNQTSTPNWVVLELYGKTNEDAEPERAAVLLQPHERREWNDTVDALFARSWAGAMRLRSSAGPIAVSAVTCNAALPPPLPPLLAALPEADAIRGGDQARLGGLAYGGERGSEIRTNVGIVNLAAATVTVVVTAYGAGSGAIGRVRGRLAAFSYGEVDGVFARVGAPAIADGAVEVTTVDPPGPFLAYASVIRGPRAQAEYVYPAPPR